MSETQGYPKPREIGGRLIRQTVACLRGAGVGLPITSDILIAVSSGSDSVALAHLLTHFGRRIAPRSCFSILHVHHGWRGEASDADADFVGELAARWKVPFILHRVKPPRRGEGSWEDIARRQRMSIFDAESKARNALVATAHQADDLAETMLWRLLTGNAAVQGAGILLRDGRMLRPLLTARREDLRLYLKEEDQTWREDSSNDDPRFLRARMRRQLMPAVEQLFPQAVHHLAQAAFEVQNRTDDVSIPGPEALFGAAGLRVRRAHWAALAEKSANPRWRGELHLPGGWKLSSGGTQPERWVLEKNPDVKK